MPNDSRGFQDSDGEICAVLFLDVVRYSTLSEHQIKSYVINVLPLLAETIETLRPSLLEINTWGDGIVAASRDSHVIAELALKLRDTFRTTNFEKFFLPPNLSCRIGLHAGRVLKMWDPIRGKESRTGTQINLAARLEPIAKPGHIFATDTFFGLFRDVPDSQIVFDDLGEKELAKRFGSKHLYHMRRRTDSLLPANEVIESPYSLYSGISEVVEKGNKLTALAIRWCIATFFIGLVLLLINQFFAFQIKKLLVADQYPVDGFVATFNGSPTKDVRTSRDEQLSLLSDSPFHGSSKVYYEWMPKDPEVPQGDGFIRIHYQLGTNAISYVGVFAPFSTPAKLFDVSRFSGVGIRVRAHATTAVKPQVFFQLGDDSSVQNRDYAWPQIKLPDSIFSMDNFAEIARKFAEFANPEWSNRQSALNTSRIFEFIILIQGPPDSSGWVDIDDIRFQSKTK